MAFRKKLIHKDAIRLQSSYDKQRKKDYEKRNNSAENNNKDMKIGDNVLRQFGDKYVGNKKKLQPQYDNDIWNVIDIMNDGNSFKIKNEYNKIKIVHRTKVKKYKNTPESYWVYLDNIKEEEEENVMDEEEFNDWMIRKSSRYKDEK